MTSKSTLKSLTINLSPGIVRIDCIGEFLALERLSIPYQMLADNHHAFFISLPKTLVDLVIVFSSEGFSQNVSQRLRLYLAIARSALEVMSEQELYRETMCFQARWAILPESLMNLYRHKFGKGTINKDEKAIKLELDNGIGKSTKSCLCLIL